MPSRHTCREEKLDSFRMVPGEMIGFQPAIGTKNRAIFDTPDGVANPKKSFVGALILSTNTAINHGATEIIGGKQGTTQVSSRGNAFIPPILTEDDDTTGTAARPTIDAVQRSDSNNLCLTLRLDGPGTGIRILAGFVVPLDFILEGLTKETLGIEMCLEGVPVLYQHGNLGFLHSTKNEFNLGRLNS